MKRMSKEDVKKHLLKQVPKLLSDISRNHPSMIAGEARDLNIPSVYVSSLSRCGIITKTNGKWHLTSNNTTSSIVDQIVEDKTMVGRGFRKKPQRESVSVDSTVEWLKKNSFDNCTTNVDELKERVSKYDQLIKGNREKLLKSIGTLLLNITDNEPCEITMLYHKLKISSIYRRAIASLGIIKKIDGKWKVESNDSIDNIVDRIMKESRTIRKARVSQKEVFETFISDLKERMSKFDSLPGSFAVVAQTSTVVMRALKGIEPQMDEVKEGLSTVKSAIFDMQVIIKDNTAATSKLLTTLITLIEKESLK